MWGNIYNFVFEYYYLNLFVYKNFCFLLINSEIIKKKQINLDHYGNEVFDFIKMSFNSIFENSKHMDLNIYLIKYNSLLKTHLLFYYLSRDNNCCFFYYIPLKNNESYLLICFKNKIKLKNNFYYNESDIKNKLLTDINWELENFDDHFLFWKVDYQDVLSDYLDLITGGLLSNLPNHWICFDK